MAVAKDMMKLLSASTYAVSLTMGVASIGMAVGQQGGDLNVKSQYVQSDCNVSNNEISIQTFDLDAAARGNRHPNIRTFVFDATGVTFQRPPIWDAANYSLVKEIRYLWDPEHKRGYLSVAVTIGDGNEDNEELGYVDEACWNALSELLKRKNAPVKLDIKDQKNQQMESAQSDN